MYDALIDSLKGGLIVSCQAYAPNPFAGGHNMARFAQAAEMAGAVGLRVNSPADVAAVAGVTSLPIIGIDKQVRPDYPVYITPTVEAAAALVRAGATVVAVDATARPRYGGLAATELIRRIRAELGVPVMADIDTVDAAVAAAHAGADIVATTLAGYTAARPATDGPDLALLADVVAAVHVPVICEGRIRTPEDLQAALVAGAHAVVVGTAITNPQAIAAGFVAATRA